MHPLNPFLSAFFKSPLPSQCNPPAHHILLVPTTEVLLTSRETESGAASVADFVASEEFLGSHVLRIPLAGAAGVGGGGGGGKGGTGSGAGGRDVQNLREVRGKAKQYNTVNGRSVVIKDNLVYSNKGFKSLAHATLLGDAIWYSDTLEPRPWLIYYITKPLVGTWEEVKLTPAMLPAGRTKSSLSEQSQSPAPGTGGESADMPRKKDIKSFHELLSHFPIIARQMQPGLEKLFREFTVVFERPLPPPPSASHIPDPEPDGPILSAMKRVRSNSLSAKRPRRPSSAGGSRNGYGDAENLYAEDDEDVMRASLETAVTNAIDSFQSVDKQQLSLLGATTDLTGPVVERLIERYVAENVHRLLYPLLSAKRRQEDLQLEAKIRQMEFVDISQLGITLEGGARDKQDLTLRLARAVDELRRMTHAASPQEMMEVLLSTVKALTRLTDSSRDGPERAADGVPSEKRTALTVNADTLVSLLLFVVIRAQMRHLLACLTYIRHFIFVEDVDNGEMGYALSTFEAVLSYLDADSAGLRRASRRNKALWDAASRGDMAELRKIMEPSSEAVEDDAADEFLTSPRSSRRGSSVSRWSFANGSSSRRSSALSSASDMFSQGSGLSHVFPFQSQEDIDAGPSLPVKRVKKVAVDTRSLSSGSEVSFHSRATSIGTLGSALEGDTSVGRLAQTHDAFGGSVPMMAVQNERPEALRYLLSRKDLYPPRVVLEDSNNDGTSLLSAAVQLGSQDLISIVLDYLADCDDITLTDMQDYFAIRDVWGRSVAHYLFHAPFLIANYGRMMPWRQKDKNGQTPLFALCRSYDHANYHVMVDEALDTATEAQGDGEPLHLDDHVDNKGNTLLHIVNDAQLAVRILQKCDVDVNATNEKRFTPLMVASKYGRFDMVRALYGDPRVDLAAKELRGLTAVELAKDDDVRNKIDDLTLFSVPPGPDARTTAVVRAYFVEDASVRFVLKSGAPVDRHSYAVTTCRRSLADFEHLARLLALEHPASWIPSLGGLRSPFQIPSRPSRATLRDLQARVGWFLRVMLAHSTFATHEMLWEFFLVPDLQADMMEQRGRLKAETRAEKVRDELEPLEDAREVEQFVDHARDIVRSVNYAAKTVARRTNAVAVAAADLHDAALLLSRAVSTLAFLPPPHAAAVDVYARALAPLQSGPAPAFHASLLALQSTIEALLTSLARPPRLVAQIAAERRAAERNYASLGRSARWPLGLLDDTRLRLNEEREGRARRGEEEAADLARELRYSQGVVAGELAGWHELHEKMGRRAIRELARGMLVAERMRLEGMKRALRRVREAAVPAAAAAAAAAETNGTHPRKAASESERMNGAEMGEGSAAGGEALSAAAAESDGAERPPIWAVNGISS